MDTLDGVMGLVTWSRLEKSPHEPRGVVGVRSGEGAEAGRGDCKGLWA